MAVAVSKKIDKDILHICIAVSLSSNLCRGTYHIDVLVLLLYFLFRDISHIQHHNIINQATILGLF
jgi:hypothetical protein